MKRAIIKKKHSRGVRCSKAIRKVVKFTESKGMKVLQNIVNCNRKIAVITDRYAAYNYFADKNRQICWAHLSRDFERLAHSWNIEVKVLGCYLRNVATELFALKKALLKSEIDVLRFVRRARKLRKRTKYYLKEISRLPEAIGASRVAKNVLRSERMMWKFLDDPENIPLTNNHAERQIRHYVVYRKNSYFTQSKRGNTFLERIISLYLTWKQRGLNPFQNLLSIVS
ncbi:transposase-like [Wolbachia endosymbiont of Drosophila simulans]|nr:transposase-like [Wolbachia endosymbiont of Drosophila simulans]